MTMKHCVGVEMATDYFSILNINITVFYTVVSLSTQRQ